MLTITLAGNLLSVFEGNNWTDVSLKDTLQGLSWQEATRVTPVSPNSIAALLHHLQYWNRIIIQRLQGINPVIPEENGFVITPPIHNEEGWQQLIAQTKDSFAALADAMRDFPESRLAEPFTKGRSSFAQNLFGIVEHAYYHLGQIVIIKKALQAVGHP